MPGMRKTLLFTTLLLGSATAISTLDALSARQSSSHDEPPSEAERARLLAKGKEVFVERCARCHNERGDKALKTGLPLNERGLSTEVIARAVSGRLRDQPEDDRHAVTLYIASLMQGKAPRSSGPKP